MRPTPHVVDASVVVPLILPAPGDDDQLGLDALIDDPDVDVFAPTIMDLEVLNVAARRRGLSEDQLVRLVEALERLTITRTD
ncbi:MAG: type II toxin-antitoxin system VapC family toxin, partial [Actinomycetota bacterium]